MSYSYNNVPIIPGAYLVNGGNPTTNELYHLPIFGSISDLTKFFYNDEDNVYYLLPGYKLVLYNDIDYGTQLEEIDNTSGTKIRYITPTTINECSSIKLFYNNVEISNKYTYTSTYSYTTGTLPTPTTGSLNGSYRFMNLSVFPGAYLIDATANGVLPIFFSISDLSTFLDITDNRDDLVIVMPGYKLILYISSNFTGNYVIIDNTSGTTIIVGDGYANNSATSFELFFENKKINQSDIVS